MIYLKESPKGIDIQIQRMQEYLYEKLLTSLNCEVVAYGRVYKEQVLEEIEPLAYLKNGEYKNVLTEDTIKGLHYFFVENNQSEVLTRTCMSSNTIDVIVIIDDLTKVKSDIVHYPDEEIKEEIKSYLKSFFEIQSVVKGRDALDGFDISKLEFKYPYYVFKLTGTINNY